MGQDFYTGTFDSTTTIVTITSALSLYNAVELLLLIFTTFTAYHGLYFWSLLVATTGLIPYAVGLILQYFRLTATVAGLVINNYGWWTTITGQSVVLYSRLGVVLGKGNERILRAVKWMIIVDAVVYHVTTTVVVFGSYYAAAPAREPLSRAYVYVEKIQMTGFCVQEFIISGLYLWKTMDIVKTQAQPVQPAQLAQPTRSASSASEQSGGGGGGGARKPVVRVMGQLFIINLVIVAMDIALLVVEYKDLHVPEVAFKGLCYSVKLKLEFAVLSRLVEVAGVRRTFSLANTLDSVADGRQTDGQPEIWITRGAVLATDPSHNTGTSKLMHSFGSQSSSPPEWLEDLEKIRTLPVDNTPQPNPNVDVARLRQESMSDARTMSIISTFNNISVSEPPVHRRVRRDSDLLYASAIREMAKTS
ncbi:integral membrane protein [Cladophialophora carrionii]|uniref:Integral membrane protein n=1 Tax=Cladophialophora carrionii TaxID=86049 RepID=A0A1C1D0R9_9EURO|nr:integral membrane protein [Cladophialophora carrionii]